MSDPNPTPGTDFGRNTNTADVVIIGAGISGIVTAIDMIRHGNGRNFIIVEKGDRVGGTWSDNRYPGCSCDVASHLYSFSFEPNLRWTRTYAGQQEILAYLIEVAQKYKLYGHIRFNTMVTASKFDKTTGCWTTMVQTPKGSKAAEFDSEYTIESRFLVSAVGSLNIPEWPNIKGLDQFNGKSMHTARWDWSYPLEGKRIGVIGNGSSAVQLVPEVAKVAKQVVVFQRSSHWIIPRNEARISPSQYAMFKYVPFLRRLHRARIMDAREQNHVALFDLNGPRHQLFTDLALSNLDQTFPPEGNIKLRAKLIPDYPLGCKRVILSDDYYPAFTEDHVILETAPVTEITQKGVRVGRGYNSKSDDHEEVDYEFDLLVHATGFKATSYLWPMDIRNSEGLSLEELWNDGASAYLGMTLPGFPNFAMLFGPNTHLGHNSILLMIEAQSLYTNVLIKKVLSSKDSRDGRVLSIEPRQEVHDAWNKILQEKLRSSSVASPKCSSWYKTDAGYISTFWSETVVDYQKQTSRIDWSDYLVTDANGEEIQCGGTTKWSRVVEETQVGLWLATAGGAAIVASAAIGAIWYFRVTAR